MKKDVLLIDPWGVRGSERYLNGLISGLSENVNLTLITNKYYELVPGINYKVIKLFFKKSENMDSGLKRKVIRGLEYINAYRRIIRYLKKRHFHVIHINWLLMYSLDCYFLKALKCKCDKLVYTAHNVIPHVNGMSKVPVLRKIYVRADIIILHGKGIRDEFIELFPEFNNKIYIQKHGAELNTDISYNEKSIPDFITKKIMTYNKVFLFIGNLFYNKGVDRLIPVWEKVSKENLLVIVGEKNKDYKELEEYRDRIIKMDNILLIDQYVSDNVANYLISRSDLLLMPYRHASMSAVVFTAATFAKPIWCTKVGALVEYLNEQISFLVENTEESLCESLLMISNCVSKDEFVIMGKKLQEHIRETCSWDLIAKRLIEDCYN